MNATASNTPQQQSSEISPETIESVKQQDKMRILQYELCEALGQNVDLKEAVEQQADQIDHLEFKLLATEKMLGDTVRNADRQMAAMRMEFGRLKIQVSY